MSAKKTPCDECRERKRRCTYDKPCQRCIKFNISCVYTIQTSPADEEYLQQIKLLEEVDQLHCQLDSIQQEMVSLHLASPLTEEVSSPSTTFSNDSISTVSSYSPLSAYATVPSSLNGHHNSNNSNNYDNNNNNSDTNSDTRIVKRQRTQQGLEAMVQRDTPNSNWTLTVSKGNLIIRTDINTYAELMDYFCKSVGSVEMNNVIHCSVDDISTNRKDALSSILQVFVWKRYGKSRFKTITYGFHRKCYNIRDNSTDNWALLTQQNDASTTLQLLHTYLCCCHLDHLAIHVPTFLKLLVRLDVMQSPAVLALCAVACTSTCHHIIQTLPPSANLNVYGRFYFEQARELAMDNFDEPSLEIFATFVLMAFYKLLLQQTDESQRYGDMAERIAVILAEQSLGDEAKMLFERLEMQLFHILAVSHLSNHKNGVGGHQSDRPPLDRRILNLFHGASDLLQPTCDDTDQEKRHILLKNYVHQLNRECHNTAHQAPSEDTVNYVGIVGHMVEMAMRRWYAALPDSFRLDIPLFDSFRRSNNTTTATTIAAMEAAPDVIPFLATLTVYNEYMMMAKAHICKTPDDLETRESIAAYWKANNGDIDFDYVCAQWGRKWSHRLAKLEDFMKKKRLDQYYDNKANGKDDDNDIDDPRKCEEQIITALLESGYAGFDDPAAEISVTVAINSIQLLQYIRQVYPCHYNQRVALNAWHILWRATKFGFGDRATLHANLVCCLDMVREEFNRIPYKAILVNYVAKMEQELDDLYS